MNKLVTIAISKTELVNAEIPTNHVLVIDCSGSMCYDLPKMRQQLKNKLPAMVKENDTVSLVWFSGKGEFGRLVDRVKVNDLNDLNRLNTAIDRWLKPMGLTGFVEPLRSVADLVEEQSGVYSMMFLTDGCDNQWSHSEIMEATKSLETLIAGAVFVEYGWYCNHKLLDEMASEIGGSVVFAEDFDRYEPIFDDVICKDYKSANRISIEVGNPLFDLVWAVGENGPKTFKVKDGKVNVPEATDEIFYFTDGEEKFILADHEKKAILQGLSVLVLRRKGLFVKQVLKELGFGTLYNKFSNCFGKQALYDFQGSLLKASKEPELEENEGIIENKTAFTVLDLLSLLKESRCKIDLGKLKYNRIGRRSEPDKRLTDEEKKSLIEAIENAQDQSEVSAAVEKMVAAKKEIKFNWSKKQHVIKSLTWNETRPNVSMLFQIEGTAEIGENDYQLPKEFKTAIWRNYTIIRDGLLNIDVLPVVLTKSAYDVLSANNVLNFDEPFVEEKLYEIDLRRMPLLNESMVEEVSAKEYFSKLYEFLTLKAAKKICNAFMNEISAPERAQTLSEIYGKDAAEWLLSIGISDQGFSPKTVLTPSTDRYMATELITKMKGISSIPSFNAFKKKLDEGKKLNPADQIMAKCYNDFLSIKGQYTVNGELDKEEFEKQLLEDLLKIDFDLRLLTVKLAKMRFSIIVGQTWFKEFESIENCKLSMEFNGQPIECSVELEDTEVAI